MPVSKDGNLYFSQEQYNFARYEASTLEYAKAAGYVLEREGKWYHLKEHNSFVFCADGQWFWNSRGMHGGAIEFLTQIEHKTIVEAVLILNGERLQEQSKQSVVPRETAKQQFRKTEQPQEKKPFELPERSPQYKRLFAYLCSTRMLDIGIVKRLVDQNQIYESVNRVNVHGEEREIHNAVFVSHNDNGEPKAAFQRGLSTMGKSYKGDVPGSDKENYGWLMRGVDSVETVSVFEASIDAISHATLHLLAEKDYNSEDRLALGGNMNHQPLLNYLKDHPQVKTINICFDADEGGEKGTAKLLELLRASGYTKERGYFFYRQRPSDGKDFNEMLIAKRAQIENKDRQEHAPAPATGEAAAEPEPGV